jgi:aryl carrier-like protein
VVFDCLGQTREHYSLFLLDLGSDFFRAMNFVSSLKLAHGELQIDDKQPKNVVFDCLGQTREHYSLFLLDLGSDFFRAMNFVSSLKLAHGELVLLSRIITAARTP